MKKYIFNFNWLFIDKIIRIFGGLFVGIWVARYLGPEVFGVLSYAMAFVGFFSFFSTLGLNSIVVREIVKNEDDYSNILGTTFYLKLFGGIVSFIFGAIFIYFFKSNEYIQIITIVLLAGYIFQSMDVIEYFFQAKILSKYVVIARNISFLISSILKIYFIFFEYSVISFAFATLIDIAAGSIFMFIIYKKLGFESTSWKLDIYLSKKLIKYSWPIMLSTFFTTIYMKIDQVMIESFLDMHSVGLFSVAVRLAEAWYFIPMIIISTLVPYFVKIRETNFNLYLFRLKQVNTLMFWMSVLVGVITTFLGEFIISILFGDMYKDAYLALSLNIWAGIFVSIGMALSSLYIVTENLQIYTLIGTVISVLINIVANYFLIPIYGISGAAIATLVTQGLGVWFLPLFFKPIRGIAILSITSIVPFYLLKGKK